MRYTERDELRNNFTEFGLFLLLVSAVFSHVFSEERPDMTSISVYGIKSIGVSENLAASLQEHIEAKLLGYRIYDVMSRNNIDMILKESRFQQTGACSDKECILEAGNILGVEKILTGTVSMVGSNYNIVLKVIDVETAKIESSVSQGFTDDPERLLGAIEGSLKQLVGRDTMSAEEIKRAAQERERVYKKHIQKLKKELKELKTRSTAIKKEWKEERDSVSELQSIQREQEEKIEMLKELKVRLQKDEQEKGFKREEREDDTPALEEGDTDSDEKYAGTDEPMDTDDNKGKRIGIGAAAVFGAVGISLISFQVFGNDK